MKRKWLVVSLVGFSLMMRYDADFATVLDRPTLFLELLQQNEQLSHTAVVLMTQYLANPTAKDLAELKSLFRKAIGDSERQYLALNGFTVDDFVSGLDTIAHMPSADRQQLMDVLSQKAYPSAYELLSQYDKAVLIGQEVIPLADGNGKLTEPTNAKIDFEKMLKNTYEHSSNLSEKVHWASSHVGWLKEDNRFEKALWLGKNPDQLISHQEYLTLLTSGFKISDTELKGSLNKSMDEPIQRIEAMSLLYEAMQLSNTVVSKTMSCQFTDMQMLEGSQQKCVMALVSNQIVKGYTDGTLKPNQTLSFGEAWAMIRLALD